MLMNLFFRLNEGRCEIKTMYRIELLIAKTSGIVTKYKVLIDTHIFEKALIAKRMCLFVWRSKFVKSIKMW